MFFLENLVVFNVFYVNWRGYKKQKTEEGASLTYDTPSLFVESVILLR